MLICDSSKGNVDAAYFGANRGSKFNGMQLRNSQIWVLAC